VPKVIEDIKLEKKDIDEIIARFHYSPEDYEMLSHLYSVIKPILETGIYYQIYDRAQEGISLDNYGTAIVTLGQGIDELIELFLSHEQVSMASMADSIGLMLLTKAYEKLVDTIQKKTDLSVTKLEFLGDNYDMSLLDNIYSQLKPDNVRISNSGMLMPLKSVCVILPLEKSNPSSTKDVCNICTNCKKMDCLMRKEIKLEKSTMAHSYGNMKIFGERKK